MKFTVNDRKFKIIGSNKKDVQVMFTQVEEPEQAVLVMYDGPALGVHETTEMINVWSECDDVTLVDSCIEVLVGETI